MVVNTNDPIEVGRGLIKEALESHFKGRNKTERLQKATDDVTSAIVHLFKTSFVSQKGKLGATVMTHSASEKNPVTGEHSVPPRQL